MALLRQTARPGSAASWTEFLYDGEVHIVNGEVTVEDQNKIDLLLGRGFEIVAEEEAKENKPVRILGVIRYGNEVEPQGTQTVEAEEEIPALEPEKVEEAKEEVQAETVEEPKAPEPTVPAPPVKRGRGRPRKNPPKGDK